MLNELRLELERRGFGVRKVVVDRAALRVGSKLIIEGREVVDFTSWDYLSIGERPGIKRSAQVEIENCGLSSASPRSASGTRAAHCACEKRLARFFGTEAAILFPSRNQAILSLFTSLLTEKDCVIFDERLLSVVGDAAMLVGAEGIPYSFDSLSGLEALLEKGKGFSNRFVVVQSLSQLSGTPVELLPISAACNRFRANLVVDESLAIGAIGLRGAGVSEGCIGTIGFDICSIFSDLGAGLGLFGAAVCGSRLLIDHVVGASYTLCNEAALPSHIASAVCEALDVVEVDLAARKSVCQYASDIRALVANIRHKDCDISFESPLACIEFKHGASAVSLQTALFERGFLVGASASRRALSDSAIVRMVVSSRHSAQDIESLIKALGEVVPRVDVSDSQGVILRKP